MKTREKIAREIFENSSPLPLYTEYKDVKDAMNSIANWHIKQIAQARKETADEILKCKKSDDCDNVGEICPTCLFNKCQEIINSANTELNSNTEAV